MVRKPFMHSGLLQANKVALGHSDVHALIFSQSRASRLTVAPCLLLEIRNTLSFPPLYGIEQTFLFLSQFHSESPPKYCRVIFRLGMTVLRNITSSFSAKGTRQA